MRHAFANQLERTNAAFDLFHLVRYASLMLPLPSIAKIMGRGKDMTADENRTDFTDQN